MYKEIVNAIFRIGMSFRYVNNSEEQELSSSSISTHVVCRYVPGGSAPAILTHGPHDGSDMTGVSDIIPER